MNLINKAISSIKEKIATRDKLSALQKILASGSGDTVTPYSLFNDVDDDVWLWLNTAGYRQNPALRKLLPSLPDEKLQLQYTGRSGDETLSDGFASYRLFKRLGEQHIGDLSHCNNIMDFGCGWGRIIRFFLRDVEPTALWGIDADEEILTECEKNNKWCNYKLIDTSPPISFADNKFDMIYCYSVFSHLSEEMHLKWLNEFNRILRPDGILIATTRPREFINYCAKIREQHDLPPHALGTSKAFMDTEKCLTDYDKGEFCWSSMRTGEWSFFGESCIPKQYVVNKWTEYFKYLDFVDDRDQCAQNVIVVQKPVN